MATRGNPKIKPYGDTGAEYGGQQIKDSIPKGDIDHSNLNNNTLQDVTEFNSFERSVNDYVLARLGHPVVRVELTSFQIKTCIDEAITKLEYHAPMWARNFATLEASANVGLYVLPDHIAQNLSYVVYKKSLLATNFPTESFESDAFISFFAGVQNRFYSNMGDFYLMQQHLETMRKILSNDGSWDVINGNMLQLYPTPGTAQPVILEYRALDSNTLHPAYRNWIQKYTLALGKMTLGEIRGKYKSLPSPGGGAILNGAEMKQEGIAERDKLEELLKELEEPPVFTMF